MYRTAEQKEKGFTLVETLIAITVLLVTIVAPMTIAARSIQNAYFARDQIAATYLAQESMERVFQVRNEDALDGGGTWDWYAQMEAADCNPGDGGCDYSGGSFTSCDDLNGCVLEESSTSQNGQFFFYGSGSSPFTRVVTIEELVPGREAEVTVEVFWEAPELVPLPNQPSVLLRSIITNQYE